MHIFHASWILPIAQPPIRDGWVAVDSGRVVSLGGRGDDLPASLGSIDVRHDVTSETDLGGVAVMPGLVNAHTHLELSWMRAAVTGADRFSDWIRGVMALRFRPPGEAIVARAVSDAISECHRFGTALVGDVTNTLITIDTLAASPLHALIFHELIGFRNGDAAAVVAEAAARLEARQVPANVRLTLAAHAPYSVSPSLFRGIKTAISRKSLTRSSVHVGESMEELEFLEAGTGPWRTLLEELGVWDSTWVAPSCDPVEYLNRIGFLDPSIVYVHGVHLRPAALQHLARSSAALVTCPRGNRLTRAGSPPIAAFYSAGLRVALGTDSLASVPDLNLFAELRELRQLAPDVPARMFLESATVQGARALGWETDFGTIEPGRNAALISITVPDRVADVEEYLVTGIQPEQIRWIHEVPGP